MSVSEHPGLSLFFKVTLDVVDLGFWTKVSGLGMTIATDDRGELGHDASFSTTCPAI